MAANHNVLIVAVKNVFPQVSDGPAGFVFDKGASVELADIIEGMAIVDMVIQRHQGSNPWKNERVAALMAEQHWYEDVSMGDLCIARDALSLIAAIDAPATAIVSKAMREDMYNEEER